MISRIILKFERKRVIENKINNPNRYRNRNDSDYKRKQKAARIVINDPADANCERDKDRQWHDAETSPCILSMCAHFFAERKAHRQRSGVDMRIIDTMT